MGHRWLLWVLGWLTVSPSALANPALSGGSGERSALPWMAEQPKTQEDLRTGSPLVVEISVALCDNSLIWCGAKWAGQPAHPENNVYWGALFGARRFFERKGSGWERVDLLGPLPDATVDQAAQSDPLQHFVAADVLERAIYRRWVSGAPFGAEKIIEEIVVLEAFHGRHIDDAVQTFFHRASSGHRVAFRDGTRERLERVQVVGYAGHNRLMERRALLPLAAETGRSALAIPSFVLACSSDSYFSPVLQAAGSAPLITTRTLMAPEGYVLDAVTKGLGEGLSVRELRRRVVLAYSTWQRISLAEAGKVFSDR